MIQKLSLHFQMGSGDMHGMFRIIIVIIIHLDTLAMGGDSFSPFSHLFTFCTN